MNSGVRVLWLAALALPSSWASRTASTTTWVGDAADCCCGCCGGAAVVGGGVGEDDKGGRRWSMAASATLVISTPPVPALTDAAGVCASPGPSARGSASEDDAGLPDAVDAVDDASDVNDDRSSPLPSMFTSGARAHARVSTPVPTAAGRPQDARAGRGLRKTTLTTWPFAGAGLWGGLRQ
jgi:hypothetical protein